jgi:hypothetical protein
MEGFLILPVGGILLEVEENVLFDGFLLQNFGLIAEIELQEHCCQL